MNPLEALFFLPFMMTVQRAGAGPLNANGVPLPPPEAQVLKNGLPSALPDINVCPVSL